MKRVLLFLFLTALYCQAGTLPDILKQQNPVQTEITALRELTDHLQQLYGKAPRLLDAPQKGICIEVKADRSMKPEAWRITRNNNRITVSGGLPQGVLYGVYELLERFAGIYWLTPLYTHIPENGKLSVPEKTDISGIPSFAWRGIFVFPTKQEHKLKFFLRNRENIFFEFRLADSFRKQYGIRQALGSPAPLNTLYHYSKKWDFEQFKDAFSMTADGKRIRSIDVFGPGQICFTSPKARNQFIKQLREYIAVDSAKYGEFAPKIYNISINDTTTICHCPDCVRQTEYYGSNSGVMLEFVNCIADNIAKDHPDITIQTSCYLTFELPPKHKIKPARNAAVRCSLSPMGISKMNHMLPLTHPNNKIAKDILDSWCRLGRIQIWDYWFYWGQNEYKAGGTVNIDTIVENLKYYHQKNAEWVFSECEAPVVTSFQSLKVWMGYQLKNNVSLDPEKLRNIFFNAYYGPAAHAMRKLYDLIVEKQAPYVPANDVSFQDKRFFEETEKILQTAIKAAGKNETYLLHIAQEQTALDIAFFRKFPGPGNTVREARLKKNWRTFIEWENDTYAYKRMIRTMNDSMKTFFVKPVPEKEKEMVIRHPLPDQLKGRKGFEFAGKDFTGPRNKGLARYGALKFHQDPEALEGMAIGIDFADQFAPAPFRKNQKSLEMGIQSRHLKQSLLTRKIQLDQLPQDEKFHLYYLGRINMTPQTLIWLHYSWYIQQEFYEYYREGKNNTFDVYVSLKYTGNAFVKGSKKKDMILCDRILLLEPK